MISNVNPCTEALDIDRVDCRGLLPQRHTLADGHRLDLFPDNAIELLRLNFTFEAGTIYQPKRLLAAATNQLFAQASRHHSAQQVAEFMDAHGIAMERELNFTNSTLCVYTLTEYAEELLPLLHELLTEPLFSQKEFKADMALRRQQQQKNWQRTSFVARNLYYRAIYGPEHPLGQYAVPEDVEQIALSDVEAFYRQCYDWPSVQIDMAGHFDEHILHIYNSIFSTTAAEAPRPQPRSLITAEDLVPTLQPAGHIHQPMERAVQSTIRIGRLLPWQWNDLDYYYFQILNTLLGGYFGSRLMSNLREDKGYTYGISSQASLFRGSMPFTIMADVNGKATQASIEEIYKELRRLQNAPVPQAELDMVKNYLVGDFIRSIDGIFERNDYYRMQQQCGITEQATELYKEALRSVSPAILQRLAQDILNPADLTEVVVGVV